MEEARTIIRRLERIDELRRMKAPAAVLLGEVRQLLHEGEAWIAAEGREEGDGAARPSAATAGAAAALASCRASLAAEREVMLGTTETAAL